MPIQFCSEKETEWLENVIRLNISGHYGMKFNVGGFGVQGSGFRVPGSRFWVQSSRFLGEKKLNAEVAEQCSTEIAERYRNKNLCVLCVHSSACSAVNLFKPGFLFSSDQSNTPGPESSWRKPVHVAARTGRKTSWYAPCLHKIPSTAR